jgi:hypothetical protein
LKNEKSMVIGWKLAKLDASIASVRYRALFPLIALHEKGITSKVFASSSVMNLTGIDVLVIVKSFSASDIFLSHLAFEKKIPVIFDLCDNIFFEKYSVEGVAAKNVFLQIAKVAAAIITPTEILADLVRDKLGEKPHVYIVPDGIETESLVKAAYKVIEYARELERQHPLREYIRDSQNIHKLVEILRTDSVQGIIFRIAKFAYRKFELVRAEILKWPLRVIHRKVLSSNENLTPSIRRGISKFASKNARRLLWFGNHGGNHFGRFGMIDLVDNRTALERIAREFDVELVVVSNHSEKFQQLIAPLAIPTRYVEWSPSRLQEEMAHADVVLVPNSCDAFSICKSANRTVLALMANRPVVATLTNALRPLFDCIEVEDFYTGIYRYLTDQQHVETHLAKFRDRCDHLYGQETIASSWKVVLNSVSAQTKVLETVHPEIILVANLVQDIEFICSIITIIKDKGIPAAIWVSTSMIRRWPYTLAILSKSGAPLRVLEETRDGAIVLSIPNSVRAVLTITDTNLGPHRFSRSITKAANKAGITTGTLQHGFENVGLTYSDALHVIDRIEFESRHIYIWGDLNLLHPRVSKVTRRKCIPVGFPKMAVTCGTALPSFVPAGKPIVGIYENLHWHRYDDEYRNFFIDGVIRLAMKYPNLIFIIKPHNAGLWLTTRFEGGLVPPANLLIADPSEHHWEGHTATGMLPHLVGVITSPSTVALEAARAGLPVAVVANRLDLNNYSPLYLIKDAAEWVDFAASLFDRPRWKALVNASHAFVKRVLVPGDAAKRIVEHILDLKLDLPGLAK